MIFILFVSCLDNFKKFRRASNTTGPLRGRYTVQAQSTNGYNHFHNILRLFDVLTNFPFTTSETMRNYYL